VSDVEVVVGVEVAMTSFNVGVRSDVEAAVGAISDCGVVRSAVVVGGAVVSGVVVTLPSEGVSASAVSGFCKTLGKPKKTHPVRIDSVIANLK
jgi:hypothetical protein